MDRFDLINLLIETFGYKSYLEIGVAGAENNFNLIKAPVKCGVDPNTEGEGIIRTTADNFFAQNKETFDIIFIDGDHVDEQATRDISNSLLCLNPNGTIVIHDCNPTEKDHQEVPAVVAFWVGTVWKAWVRYLQTLPPAIEMFMVNNDTGIGIMKATGKGKKLNPIPEDQLTYENLDLNRDAWLNMVSLDDFKAWLKPAPEIVKPKVQQREIIKKIDAKMKTDKLVS